MLISEVGLGGVKLLSPPHYADGRGWFSETFNRAAFLRAGFPGEFAQDNQSFSRHGVLRGLHLQTREPQGKLVRVLAGQIWDVAVDLRPTSDGFGHWVSYELRPRNASGDLEMLWIPEGFAHGFLVLSDEAEVAYKVTRPYDPGGEQTLRWDDPALGIAWPLDRVRTGTPLLSPKDAAGSLLSELRPTLTGEGVPA